MYTHSHLEACRPYLLNTLLKFVHKMEGVKELFRLQHGWGIMLTFFLDKRKYKFKNTQLKTQEPAEFKGRNRKLQIFLKNSLLSEACLLFEL